MKSNNKIFSAITMIFALFALTVFVSAQTTTDKSKPQINREKKIEKGGMRGERGMRGQRVDKGMMRGLHRLDLTDAQKTQIQGIMESNRTANEPLHQELRSIMQKKRDGGTFTENDKLRFQTIKEQLKTSSDQTEQTVLALLTADQLAKFNQMKTERKERMQDHKERKQERRQNKNSNTPLSNSDG